MAGLLTDFVIEPNIMCKVKGKGGLMRGRGLEDSTCTMLLNTVTECARINATLAELFGTKRSAEEHREMTQARCRRDALSTLLAYFRRTSPSSSRTKNGSLACYLAFVHVMA